MKRLNLMTLLLTTIATLFVMTGIAFADGDGYSLDAADGSPSDAVYVDNYGRVGIGTNSPTAQLEVYGKIYTKDGALKLIDTDVDHGITDWITSNSPGTLMPLNPTNGGLLLLGLSDTDDSAIALLGIMGTDDPTDTEPAIYFSGQKKKGTASQALANTETVFQFRNANTNLITILGSGNTGIGTTSPTEKLGVNGNIHIYGSNRRLYMGSHGSTFGIGYDSTYPDYGIFYTEGSPDFVSISPNGNSTNGVVNIYGDGKVGIGTTNPGSYKLAVEGKIGAREVVVTQAAWADHVFEDNYNLQSLSQVESYIKENKHLPDVPSAKQVEEEGLSMADMMAKQMQKIEELTLYVIEQNKRIESLEKELAKRNN